MLLSSAVFFIKLDPDQGSGSKLIAKVISNRQKSSQTRKELTSNQPGPGYGKTAYTWVKVQNFQIPELLKFKF